MNSDNKNSDDMSVCRLKESQLIFLTELSDWCKYWMNTSSTLRDDVYNAFAVAYMVTDELPVEVSKADRVVYRISRILDTGKYGTRDRNFLNQLRVIFLNFNVGYEAF